MLRTSYDLRAFLRALSSHPELLTVRGSLMSCDFNAVRDALDIYLGEPWVCSLVMSREKPCFITLVTFILF